MSAEFTTIVSIASGIMAIVALVKFVTTPVNQIKDNSAAIKAIEEGEITRKQMDRAILNALQAITNHLIDGNGVQKLKDSRDELQRAISDIATK